MDDDVWNDDWDDDPFEGDLNFDSDFDGPSSKPGFIRSVVSGFLSGVVEKTIGDTDARVNTLKMALPRTWTNAFSNLRDLNDRRKEVLDDIKAESFTMVQDLQYLAGRAAKKIAGRVPNRISDGIISFSQRDFSGWERSEWDGPAEPSMEATTDDEVNALMQQEDANSTLERETIESVGQQTIGMMSQIGGRQIAGINHISTSLVRSNQLLEQLVDYQRRVKARNDSMQLNILARQYLTSAKFYKFVEASHHRMISEMKEINKYSRMSDYEKTSHSDALKRSIRESVFNTAKAKFGGIRDFVIERFGKDARDQATGTFGEITGSLRMAAEMSEGMDMNFGHMIGNAAAGIFINNIPRMIQSNKGQEYLAKFKKQFPELGKWATDAYIRLGDLGHVASYVTGNAEGLANTLAKHYQGGFSDEPEDYDSYLASLPDPDKALSKAEWYIVSTAKKLGNKGMNAVLENMWNSEGTGYSLEQRSLKDMHERALWTRRSDRTLNEVLPAWLSEIHLSLEKFRTGNDDLKAMSYDYVKATMVNHNQKVSTVLNSVLDRTQFGAQASMANEFVKSIDKDNALPKKTKEALAYRITQDVDKDLGFNPYNYLNLEEDGAEDGITPKMAAQIKKMMMAQFGITDDHVNQWFNDSTDVDRFRMASYMPTEAGRELLGNVYQQALSLGQFTPNIVDQLDILKANGFYDALKEAGIITKDEYGRDNVNTELLKTTLKEYIKNPERRTAEPAKPSPILPTRPFGNGLGGPEALPPAKPGKGPKGGPSPAGGLLQTVRVEHFDQALESLGEIKGLSDALKNFDKHIATLKQGTAPAVDMTPIDTKMGTLNDQVKQLVDMAGSRNDLLTRILERQPTGKAPSKEEERQINKAKRSLIDRVRDFSFKDTFNKGVDILLDHEPLILGGLLGGLATLAFHNPHAAALVGGGAAAAFAYGKLRSLAKARNPEDGEDLYEEGSDVPILEANKLANGNYYDATKGFLIKSWKDISGSVRDATNDTIIGARRLAGKLFTKDNKEVFLKGLNKVREWMVKAWNKIDPFGTVIRMKDRVVNRFFQMDVYKEGAKTPTLIGKSFAGGAYYKQKDGEMVQLNGWNDIDGPVYDRDGNMLISQEDYDRGLVTSMGVSVNKMGAAARKAGSFLKDLLIKAKDRAAPYALGAKNKVVDTFKADYTPIVSSIDRIYNLLCEHWGYATGVSIDPTRVMGDPAPSVTPPEKHEISEEEKERREETQHTGSAKSLHDVVRETVNRNNNTNIPPKPRHADNRLNSAEDKKEQAKEKKRSLIGDAIISIARNFGFGEKKEDEEKKKRTGLFGLLASGFSGLMTAFGAVSTFFTKGMFEGFSNLFRLATVGTRVLPLILQGIAGIGAGVAALVSGKGIVAAGGDMWDTLMNRGEEEEAGGKKKKGKKDEAEGKGKKGQKGAKGKGKGKGKPGPAPKKGFWGGGLQDIVRERLGGGGEPSGRGNWGGKLLSGGKAIGVGMAVGAATDALASTGFIDEGGAMQHVGDIASTAATVYGGYQAVTGVAAAAGLDLGIGAALGTAGTALWAGAGTLATLAAPLIFNPFTLGALAVAGAGYGIYKYVTRGKGKQIELRLAQYGCMDPDSELAKKIFQAEQALANYVVIGNARASLDKRAPIQEVIQMFVSDPTNKKQVGDVYSWFNGRFKPVFLTYMACLDVVKMKSLKEYDEASSPDVYKVAKQTHAALGGVMPFPYSIVANIDADTRILGERATIIRVNNLLEELRKYVDRKRDSEDTKPITTVAGNEALKKEKAMLETALQDPRKNFGTGVESIQKQDNARNRLTEIDKQLSQLNANYKPGSVVAEVYVKDMLPDDRAMDLMTAIRVACYGNDEDIPWRVEAVLKLERHCEALFTMNGDKAEFKGKIGDLFGLFMDAFRLTKSDAEDWCLWFRDRFLPVLTNYMQLVHKYRRGRPGVVWKTLSVTARYEIAKSLIETQVEGLIFSTSIWNVRASPFKGTRSPAKADKVTRMLKLLGEASVTAKLRDPEKEAGKTNASSWANAISPHAVGGGFTEKRANIDDPSKAKNKWEVAGGGMYGTSSATGAGTNNTFDQFGVYNTPENKYGYKPLNGDSDTSHLDMSGVKQVAQGQDKGVSVPKKLAEQLIIREMLKQGFTDPREIAMMLALTNYESGGYSQTVENMKYSSPERLVRLFKEVKSVEQARQLIAGGEVAIANTVYGGAKGASIGNTEPGDGYKFRGRGFNHLTGKANYAKYGQALGIDLVNKPELASTDPNVMAAIAVEFYKESKQMQSIKQTGDFGYAAKGLNGGNNLPGMDKRYAMYLDYLKKLQEGNLKADEASAADASTPDQSKGGDTANSMYGGGSSPAPAGGGSAPMIGSGAPPLGSAPGGGSLSGGNYTTPPASGGGGYGGYSGADAGGGFGPLVKGNPGSGAGLRLKSPEAVQGGESHPGVMAACRLIQTRVPNFRYWSALNDAYHHSKPGNSKHKSGLAADFTLTNGIAGSDAAAQVVNEIFRQAGLTNADYMVINEYRTKTANGTGGHVHFHFKSPASAAKFAAAAGAGEPAGQDTNPGGTVEEKPVEDRAMPSTPPADGGLVQQAGQKLDEIAKGNVGQLNTDPSKDYTGLPLPGAGNTTSNPQGETLVNPGNGGGGQQVAARDTAPAQRTSKPEPAAAAPAIDIDGLTKALAAALQQGGAQSQGILQAIHDQLAELNKNSKQTPPMVKT